MAAVDSLLKFLKRIASNLQKRGEKTPRSLLKLYAYCDKYIARGKGQLSKFKSYYKECKDELLKLSEGGYIHFSSLNQKEKFFTLMDKMQKQIIISYWPPQEGVIDDLDILKAMIFGPFEKLKATFEKARNMQEIEQICEQTFAKSYSKGQYGSSRVFQVVFTQEEVAKFLEKFKVQRFIQNPWKPDEPKEILHHLYIQYLKLWDKDKNWQVEQAYDTETVHYGHGGAIQVTSRDKVVCRAHEEERFVKIITSVEVLPLFNKSTQQRINLVALYFELGELYDKNEFLGLISKHGYNFVVIPNETALRTLLNNIVTNHAHAQKFKSEYESQKTGYTNARIDMDIKDVQRIFQEFSTLASKPQEKYVVLRAYCNNDWMEIDIFLSQGKMHNIIRRN